MWCVFDEDGCPVAYIADEDDALSFYAAFYAEGSMEFRPVVVTGLEDE